MLLFNWWIPSARHVMRNGRNYPDAAGLHPQPRPGQSAIGGTITTSPASRHCGRLTTVMKPPSAVCVPMCDTLKWLRRSMRYFRRLHGTLVMGRPMVDGAGNEQVPPSVAGLPGAVHQWRLMFYLEANGGGESGTPLSLGADNGLGVAAVLWLLEQGTATAPCASC